MRPHVLRLGIGIFSVIPPLPGTKRSLVPSPRTVSCTRLRESRTSKLCLPGLNRSSQEFWDERFPCYFCRGRDLVSSCKRVCSVLCAWTLRDTLCPALLSAVILTNEHLADISGEVCDVWKVPLGLWFSGDLWSHTCPQAFPLTWKCDNVVYMEVNHNVIILSYLSYNQRSSPRFQ